MTAVNARAHMLKKVFLLISVPILYQASVLAQRTIHVPADVMTIQQAINEASDGDTVSISPGTYHENIDFKGKAITVTGSATASATILDGSARAAVVTFKSNEGRSSILSNLTIQDGAPTVVPEAGGIYIYGTSPSILNNVIQNNIGCGVGSFYGGPLIEGNTIVGTTTGNLQRCEGATGDLPAEPALGTAIYVAGAPQNGLQPQIIANDIHDNIAQGPAGILLFDTERPLVENNVISNNSSNENPALMMYGSGAPIIVQNLIFGNKDDSSSVPGYVPSANAAVVLGSTKISATPVVFASNTVAYNIEAPASPTPLGSQVLIDGYFNNIVFSNNIIIATGLINPIYCYDIGGATTLRADHNDVFMVGGGTLYQGTCTDPTGSNGNISADPLFVSSTPTAATDFELQNGSPVIDAGNNNVQYLPSEDLAGNPRIQNGTGLSTAIIDMGVYEAPGVAAPPAPEDFTLSVASSSLSLANGQQGTMQVTLTPNASFQGVVSLGCGSLPANISCTFQPNQVSLGNSFPQTAQLTITVSNAEAATSHLATSLAAFLFPETLLSVFLLSRRKPARTSHLFALLMLIGLTTFISACGVKANTAPETANIEVYGTANSGTISHQASFTLNIAAATH